jgi:hypothetical protein
MGFGIAYLKYACNASGTTHLKYGLVTAMGIGHQLSNLTDDELFQLATERIVPTAQELLTGYFLSTPQTL